MIWIVIANCRILDTWPIWRHNGIFPSWLIDECHMKFDFTHGCELTIYSFQPWRKSCFGWSLFINFITNLSRDRFCGQAKTRKLLFVFCAGNTCYVVCKLVFNHVQRKSGGENEKRNRYALDWLEWLCYGCIMNVTSINYWWGKISAIFVTSWIVILSVTPRFAIL